MNVSPNNKLASGQGIRITAGARLHFGLLDTAAPFGGVGVMIDEPPTEVSILPSATFRSDDDPDGRVEEIARRFSVDGNLPPCHIRIGSRPSAHSGLGTGTQLAMAVSEALCRFLGRDVEPLEMASRFACRGERSAVGIHGYFSGGLIYEGPLHDRPLHDRPEPNASINPIRQRIELPAPWRVAIFRPRESLPAISGNVEQEQFAQLASSQSATGRALLTTLQERLLPSAESGDFLQFTTALSEYNRNSGMLFRSVQGGPYNGEAVSRLVASLIEAGVHGVGQSSWGPGVFGWFESQEQFDRFRESSAEIEPFCVTRVRNSGRRCDVIDV